MSAGNRERLEQVLEHVFAGRALGPDLLAEDAEWVNPPDAVEGGTRRGADAFNGAIAAVFSGWDDVHFDRERVIEDGDVIVALGALRGHVRGPGIAVEAAHAEVWTFRDGRVLRMQWFNTHAEALEAAGARE